MWQSGATRYLQELNLMSPEFEDISEIFGKSHH